jgi:hypothetical protein
MEKYSKLRHYLVGSPDGCGTAAGADPLTIWIDGADHRLTV